MMRPPSNTITPDEWQQTPTSVRNWIEEVLAEVKQLRETVEQFQEIVNRGSQNSSQPPSQDRPEQKLAKEPSGPPRKRGGQPGHRGQGRVLVDDVDEVVVYKPTSCARCGALLLGDDPAPCRHQVTELPIVKPKATSGRAPTQLVMDRRYGSGHPISHCAQSKQSDRTGIIG